MSHSTSLNNESSDSLVVRLLTGLGEIYTWQDASKACFIALACCLAPLLFFLWYSLHYFQYLKMGSAYIPFTGSELVLAIQCCIVLGAYMFMVSILATACVLKNKFHQPILFFSLLSVAFSQSVLFAIIGLFDGISWLTLLIYCAIGLVFLNRVHVLFTITLMVMFMMLWSVSYEYLPFVARAYQFTNAITLSSMSALDLISTWATVAGTAVICSIVLDVLMGAWRYREQDLHSKSYQDELTSVFNRRAIQDGLKEEFFRAKRGEYSLSIAMLDLDHFKNVNDSYGHPFGDKVLKLVSAKMTDITRKKDLLGRWGGEEFLIVFPECEGEQARKILDRLLENIESQLITTPQGQDINITVSAGIAELEDSDKLDELISRADRALYQAKAEGRNRVIHG